jgi:hypothetical protein
MSIVKKRRGTPRRHAPAAPLQVAKSLVVAQLVVLGSGVDAVEKEQGGVEDRITFLIIVRGFFSVNLQGHVVFSCFSKAHCADVVPFQKEKLDLGHSSLIYMKWTTFFHDFQLEVKD